MATLTRVASIFTKKTGTTTTASVGIIAALLFLQLGGTALRISPLNHWLSQRDTYFFNGNPILLNADGYYHLRQARELLEGEYAAIDMKRTPPNGYTRSIPAPLLSWFTYVAAFFWPNGLEWIAVLLPAVLGAIIVYPVYGVGAILSGRVAGLSAAAIAVTSPYYWMRSSVGWYDTDCLNVTFVAALTLAFLYFSKTKLVTRYAYLIICFFIFLLFHWWWGVEASGVVISILLYLLITAIALYFRPTGKERKYFFIALVTAAVFATAVLSRKGMISSIFSPMVSYSEYVFANANHFEESTHDYIAELAGIPLSEIVMMSVGSWWGGTIATLGLVALVIRCRQAFLLLAPLLVLAMLSFSSKRFLIYLAPISALGFGHASQILWEIKRLRFTGKIFATVIVLMTLWPIVQYDMASCDRMPLHSVAYLRAMANIDSVTPSDSIIWGSWARGYPLEFFAKRTAVFDGGINNLMFQKINAYPLASSSMRFAANFMQYFANSGLASVTTTARSLGVSVESYLSSLANILSLEPMDAFAQIKKEWKIRDTKAIALFRHLYPDSQRPLYLFLDNKTYCSPWYYLGDQLGRKQPKDSIIFVPFRGGLIAPSIATGMSLGDNVPLVADASQMIVKYGEQHLPLAGLRFISKMEVHEAHSKSNSGIEFELFVDASFGAVMEGSVYQSVFNNLFMLPGPKTPFFSIQYSNQPFVQVWKVEADKPNIEQIACKAATM